MTHLTTIVTLRRTALDAITAMRGLSPHDQLAPPWTLLRRQEVADCLAILDRDAKALPCSEARDAARRAAAEVRAGLHPDHSSNSPANSGSL